MQKKKRRAKEDYINLFPMARKELLQPHGLPGYFHIGNLSHSHLQNRSIKNKSEQQQDIKLFYTVQQYYNCALGVLSLISDSQIFPMEECRVTKLATQNLIFMLIGLQRSAKCCWRFGKQQYITNLKLFQRNVNVCTYVTIWAVTCITTILRCKQKHGRYGKCTTEYYCSAYLCCLNHRTEDMEAAKSQRERLSKQ